MIVRWRYGVVTSHGCWYSRRTGCSPAGGYLIIGLSCYGNRLLAIDVNSYQRSGELLSTEHLGSVCSEGPFDNTSPKFRISSMGTAYGLGEEYGISTPENLVKGLAYVRTANPLKGFCKCTEGDRPSKSTDVLNLVPGTSCLRY